MHILIIAIELPDGRSQSFQIKLTLINLVVDWLWHVFRGMMKKKTSWLRKQELELNRRFAYYFPEASSWGLDRDNYFWWKENVPWEERRAVRHWQTALALLHYLELLQWQKYKHSPHLSRPSIIKEHKNQINSPRRVLYVFVLKAPRY